MRSQSLIIVSLAVITSGVSTSLKAQNCPNSPVTSTASSITDVKGEDLPVGSAVNSQAWDIRRGCYAIPDGSLGPVIKISKTEKFTGSFTSPDSAANNFVNAVLDVEVRAVDGSVRQPNAIHAYAYGAPAATDVVAANFYALNTQTGNSNYGAFGLYSEGQTNNDTSRAIGAEFRSSNFGGTDRAVNLSSQSETMGLWVTTSGNKNTSVGVGVGRVPSTNARWKYGFLSTTDSATTASFVSAGAPASNLAYSGLYLINAHAVGINLYDATYSNSAIALPPTTDATGGINFGQDFNVFRDSVGGLRLPAKVGFGVASVAPPLLPAALPVDGTATSAQLAAAYNAIRSALIADGLAH